MIMYHYINWILSNTLKKLKIKFIRTTMVTKHQII